MLHYNHGHYANCNHLFVSPSIQEFLQQENKLKREGSKKNRQIDETFSSQKP